MLQVTRVDDIGTEFVEIQKEDLGQMQQELRDKDALIVELTGEREDDYPLKNFDTKTYNTERWTSK